MAKYNNYGCKVVMRFAADSPFPNKEQTLHNVTEIHYNYNPELHEKIGDGPMVAFESDWHQTGVTYPIKFIAEFETALELEKAEDF